MGFKELAEKHVNLLNCERRCSYLMDASKEIVELILRCKEKKLLIAIFGNGGSAADAEHWVGELVCTYQSKSRLPFLATALTTNSSILTAWSNDFEYETVFERQIKALQPILGLAIGLSTSGKSINVLNALSSANKMGVKTVMISGEVKKAESLSLHVIIPSNETAVIQTITQILYHSVCEELEDK